MKLPRRLFTIARMVAKLIKGPEDPEAPELVEGAWRQAPSTWPAVDW